MAQSRIGRAQSDQRRPPLQTGQHSPLCQRLQTLPQCLQRLQYRRILPVAGGLFGFREGALQYFAADMSVQRREEIEGSEHLTRVLAEQFQIDVPPEILWKVWQRLQPG